MSSWLLAQCVVEQLRQAGVRHVVLSPGSRNAPLSMALYRASRPSPVAGPTIAEPVGPTTAEPVEALVVPVAEPVGPTTAEPVEARVVPVAEPVGPTTAEPVEARVVPVAEPVEATLPDSVEAPLHLHVRIDERSAGFLALGLATATGAPVAVVTTSGTAVANLAPAVMEANEAGVPLVVLSADRPLAMAHSGANQTGSQFGLFSTQVRHQVQLASDGEVTSWRFQLRRALAEAAGTRTGTPGPVQVNLHLDVPLMPSDEQLPPATDWQLEPAPRPRPVLLDGSPRTVVLAGDASPAVGRRALQVARAGGVPLLAEPSSNARAGRAVSTYRLLLGKDDLGGRIERVVVFGHPTLSRPVTRLLSREDVEVIVVADGARWPDPGMRACRVVDDVDLAPAHDEHWLNRWLTADCDLQTRLGLATRPAPGEEPEPTGHAVAALVVERTAGQVLVLGSSNPIRDADLAPVPDALYEHPEAATRVFANRGLAGIDGVISTAVGIGLGLDEPVTCLLGDLTFLHDAGGLWLGSLEEKPRLRLVVLDDRGGSIFHTLEQGGEQHQASFEKVFGTPHEADLAALAAAHGWQAATVTDLEELGQRLRVPVRDPEVLVVPVARDGRRAWAQRLAGL